MPERKIGLVIGTNNYTEPGIKNLEFAEDDARAIKDVLLEPDLCGFDEVIEVIDKSYTEAAEKIEKILNDAEPDDFILLYFSGHGKLDMKGKLRLLFKNTKLDYLRSTSLQFDFIKQGIEESRCKKIVIIIDSCFSGAAHIKGDELEKSLESSGEGTIVLSASKEFEVSKEDEALKHGVFTYYLWDGLKTGDADTDRNGLISIDELYNYAHRKIREEKYPQHPKKSGECEGEIIIGKNPKKIKEREYKGKREKLIEKHKDGLPVDLFDEAMVILSKDYKDPSTLTDAEKELKSYLEKLLKNKIAIQTYIDTVEVIKESEPRPSGVEEKINEISSQAQKLFEEKRYAAAIAKWEEVLELEPKNRKAIGGIEEAKRILKEINELNIAAQQLHNEGKYREAIDKWNEVLNLDPENQTAKGGIKETEGKLKEKAQEKINELSSQAQKLFEEKKYTEAIAKWREVLNLGPYNRKAIEGKKEAERILEELKQLYDEGTRAAKAQEWKAAIAAFRELVALDSQYRDAAARLGEAEEKLKGIERKVKKYCPECEYPNERGLKYCTKCGAKLFERIEETEQNLKILQEKERKIDKLNISAQQLYNEGKYSEAIDEWRNVLDQDLENQTAKESIKKAEEKLKEKEREVKVEKIKEEKKLQVKKYCPNCGYPNTDRLKHCTRCGANLELNT